MRRRGRDPASGDRAPRRIARSPGIRHSARQDADRVRHSRHHSGPDCSRGRPHRHAGRAMAGGAAWCRRDRILAAAWPDDPDRAEWHLPYLRLPGSRRGRWSTCRPRVRRRRSRGGGTDSRPDPLRGWHRSGRVVHRPPSLDVREAATPRHEPPDDDRGVRSSRDRRVVRSGSGDLSICAVARSGVLEHRPRPSSGGSAAINRATHGARPGCGWDQSRDQRRRRESRRPCAGQTRRAHSGGRRGSPRPLSREPGADYWRKPSRREGRRRPKCSPARSMAMERWRSK